MRVNPQIGRRRRETVEHPFGTIKHAMNQGYFLMKGLRQVRAEFSLSALAYNLLRVTNIIGVRGLVEAFGRFLRALRRVIRRSEDIPDWFYTLTAALVAHGEENRVTVNLRV